MKSASPIWHPFTQHAVFPDSISVKRAEGAYLYTQNGQRIIDGISSWWVNTHGHCHPKIVGAVQAQAAQLDQVIFAGFTHDPAERLAEKLVAITPPDLNHVFFSDSGSTAVEAALKMAIGYWSHTVPRSPPRLFRKEHTPRNIIITLEGGYHGDTFGAMSVGDRSNHYNEIYEDYLFDIEPLPFPAQGSEGDTLNLLEAILKSGQAAALILEPLVLGAGGMLMYEPEVLKQIHDLCRTYGTLLIADEVMTGFGRTGTRFACEQAGMTPDILCLSKGLSGGFLPIGATLCTDEIYKAFYSQDRAKTFFHSSSFTGNPLSCAAACAALDIWDEEPVMERIASIAAWHTEELDRLRNRMDIRNIRQTGTIAAFEVTTEENGYLSGIGPVLYRFFLEHGVLLRPLGNTVYVLPPYCVSREDVREIYNVIEAALDFLQTLPQNA